MNKNLALCTSGGRTSMFMGLWVLENKRKEYNCIPLFCNTGWESEETLIFVNNCDRLYKERFGVSIVWLEVDVNPFGEGSGHKIVTFETASRHQEPFHNVIRKYGIPNNGYPHCTRELKEAPIKSYLDSVGWSNSKAGKVFKNVLDDSIGRWLDIHYQSYETALGMRIDEPRRLKRGGDQNKVYPLVDWHPGQPDKLDILDFWEGMTFDLGIPEHLGNCIGCFKKSPNKLIKVLQDKGERAFEFPLAMETFYGHVGNNKINGKYSKEPRTMYRNYVTAGQMIKMFRDSGYKPPADNAEEVGGCGEECRPFSD